MNSRIASSLSAAALLTCLATAPAAFAGPQQERMKQCNADAKAKALKGDERKAFMKSCLSTKKTAEAAPPAQNAKMKECNKQAADKALKGDERRKFMSECLKA